MSAGSSLSASEAGLTLDLLTGPAMTPAGLVDHERFFSGFVDRGDITAAGLLAVADVAGTRYAEWDHVLAMFLDCKRRLEEVGIHPVAYRGGHYAYHPFMNRMLAENEIFADYSCAPGLNEPTREAIWTEAALSAEYLPENPREPWAGQRRTKVLEIPIGSDGEGAR